MVFETGKLYWVPKDNAIVEYLGAAAGGQQHVSNKTTGTPLTVKTADLKPLDEQAYNHFMEEYKSQGLNMTDVWKMDDAYRGNITNKITPLFSNFTLESPEQFEDWRDNRFDMHNRAPPDLVEAVEKDNTMYWVLGGILALVFVNYK